MKKLVIAVPDANAVKTVNVPKTISAAPNANAVAKKNKKLATN